MFGYFDYFERRAAFAAIAVVVLERKRHRRRIGLGLVFLEYLQREGIGAGLSDVDLVRAAGEVDWWLVVGSWWLVESRGGDCDADKVVSVLLVDADILVEKPVLIAHREDVVRLVGEVCANPSLVLADSEDPFRKSWRIIGVGRRCRRRERRDGRRHCAVAEELDRGIDAVRGAPLDAAVVPREEIAVRGRQAVGDRGGAGLKGDAGWQGVDEG